MYKVSIMTSILQGWPTKIPGSYTLVAGFRVFQYTSQYTLYSQMAADLGRASGQTRKRGVVGQNIEIASK